MTLILFIRYYCALCAWVKIAVSSSRRMQACQDLGEEEQARNWYQAYWQHAQRTQAFLQEGDSTP